MNTEITYLVYVTLMTALLWIPYISNMILRNGIVEAVGYNLNPNSMAPWARRMKSAHYNAVENLVVFATLVLIAHAMGISGRAIEVSSVVYFWARVIHVISYTLAIPWTRTLSFLIGFGSQICIGWQILAGL